MGFLRRLMIDDRNLCKTVGELHFTCDVFVSCVMPFPNVHSRAQSDLDAVVRRRSRPPAQYLHKAVLLAISDASTEQAPVLVILTGPRVGELPAFGGEEVYFGGLVPSEQQLIQVAGSYIWGQVVFSLPVLEELLQSGALELAPGVRVHEVMSAPRTSRWAAAGGRLESINDAAAALLGDDQQRHWYQRYLGLSVEKL
ncbi:unnamed protein product [Durusdinium trenchii]|uniref:Uncharacterized protein n=1 Tax=Durusdinium trenchii TaxID=1381693 RepID=A0ABP0LL42_9DINO